MRRPLLGLQRLHLTCLRMLQLRLPPRGLQTSRRRSLQVPGCLLCRALSRRSLRLEPWRLMDHLLQLRRLRMAPCVDRLAGSTVQHQRAAGHQQLRCRRPCQRMQCCQRLLHWQRMWFHLLEVMSHPGMRFHLLEVMSHLLPGVR